MRIACSFASAPPFVKNTCSMPSGASSAMRRAASERASFTCCGAIVQMSAACSWIARTTAGCWWPMFVLTSCEERSSISLPSPSHTREPSAFTTVMGENGPCACHEWKTCFRSSSWAARPRSIISCVTGPEPVAEAAAGLVVSPAAAAGAVLSVMVIVDSWG